MEACSYIMEACKNKFYNDKFQEDLDSNTKLLCFENCVFDLGEKLYDSYTKEFLGYDEVQTGTIKTPKLQETSTLILLNCLTDLNLIETINCKGNTKKEIITVLNRRIVLPFYIPVISLLCSFLLLKNGTRDSFKRF